MGSQRIGPDLATEQQQQQQHTNLNNSVKKKKKKKERKEKKKDCSLPGSSVHGILQARILE